jgi:hypothetical protein
MNSGGSVHPLRKVLRIKGSREFSRSELVGLLSFTLKLMSVREAKAAIEEWIGEGILEERGEVLVVNEEALSESKKKEDLFEEMVDYISSSLGIEREELISELERFAERYGYIDKRLVLYLLGLDKGLDMSRFRDRLELE